MQLIWTSSGDVLDIVVENSKVIDYWVEQLNSCDKNSFEFIKASFPDKYLLDNLTNNVKIINSILTKFKIPPLINHDADWLNQNNLNLLHERWVKLQHNYKIVELLSKFKHDELTKFRDINHLIHKIEPVIKVIYDNDRSKVWNTVNSFGPDILQFGTWQIEIHYQNLGRSTYDKWINFDSNLLDSDTNNFTHFGGQVRFNLCKSFVSTPPAEYVSYCLDNSVIPYGNKLPIGNFKESITTLRHLFYKNVGTENNPISFTI